MFSSTFKLEQLGNGKVELKIQVGPFFMIWHFLYAQNCEVCHREHNRGENSETAREEGTSVWRVSEITDVWTGLKDAEHLVLRWLCFIFSLNRTIGGSSDALGKLTEADLRFLFVT